MNKEQQNKIGRNSIPTNLLDIKKHFMYDINILKKEEEKIMCCCCCCKNFYENYKTELNYTDFFVPPNIKF